jgi:hypothetical protein
MTFPKIKIATVLINLLTGANAWSSNAQNEETAILLNPTGAHPQLSPPRLSAESPET